MKAYLVGPVNLGTIFLDKDTAIEYATAVNGTLNELELYEYKVKYDKRDFNTSEACLIHYGLRENNDKNYKLETYIDNTYDRKIKYYFETGYGKFAIRIHVPYCNKYIKEKIDEILQYLDTIDYSKVNCFLYTKQGRDYNSNECVEYSKIFLVKLAEILER